MPSIWTYSDDADRGYGLFKRRILMALNCRGWETILAEAPLLDPASKAVLRCHYLVHPCEWMLLINQTAAQFYAYLEIPLAMRPALQKKIVWFLDDPAFFLDRPLDKTEYVFSFDETYVDYIRSFHPGECGFLPLAADREELGTFDERYACDVCFVGGIVDQSERRRQLSCEMTDYVDRLVELKLQQRWKTFPLLAMEFPIAPGKSIDIAPQTAHYLYWEANNLYRLRIMEALADYDLRIYGNEGWEILLRDSPLRTRFFGPLDPVKELPHVFASANININIHSIQCRGSMNQRDFNAPASGGFLLSDWVPAAGKYFIPSVEAVYWSDADDLRRKIDYYLERDSERRAIAERGRRRVLRDHTYDGRISQLLQYLSA